MRTSLPSAITIDGMTLTVTVERKQVKNVNARLKEGRLAISAPLRMPAASLDPIISELARKLIRRAHAQQVNREEDALALAQQVARRFPVPPTVGDVTFVTTQQARWGSYSTATRTIRLHAALRDMPRWVLEAVMAHELAHAIHPDHSPAFWALTRRVYPATDRAQAFLSGVSWLGRRWEQLPAVSRMLLTGVAACGDEQEDAG